MRRFVLTMVTLASLSAAVFMIGWLPLRIGPGRYAVLVTKTGGIDPAVVAPGAFRWSAATFLPTNARLYEFSPAMAERRLDLSGELPSAAAYSAFMAGEPDFTYSAAVRLMAAPRPEALPELFGRWGVADDETLRSWLETELDLAASELRAALSSAQGGPSSIDEASLALTISARHPMLDVRGVQVSASRMPDLGLYEEARRLYSAYMERFRATVEPALADASARAAGDQVRIDVLKRYGELLERYPGLVDYLAIQAGLSPRPAAGK